MKRYLLVLGIVFLIAGLGWWAKQSIGDLRPVMLPPEKSLPEIIQQVTVQPKKQPLGQPVNFPLRLPEGMGISVFAKDLGPARDLQMSPQGTLLVSVTKAGKVLALPDKDDNGEVDESKTALSGLRNPHGLAFFNGMLFVAEETKVSRYFWDENLLEARLDKKLFDLPSGGRHFTRSLAFDSQGRLFVSIGSTCDVCYEKDPFLAAIIVSDQEGATPQLYAKGLRNAVFINFNQQGNELWSTEMGRDFLGDNLPPDEINLIKQNGDYGWPICYGNNIHDTAFDKNTYIRDPCADKIPPVFAIPAHSAPLGLVFINSPQLPDDWQGDLLVAYHGSWNRSVPDGYKVVRLKMNGDQISGSEDFITGFLQGSSALGRPVDLEFDNQGTLYISDDKAGAVYRVFKS